MTIRSCALLTLAIGAVGMSPPLAARTPRSPGHAAAPSTPDASGPIPHLLAARAAVDAGRYAQAGDALARAETRLLNDAAADPDPARPSRRLALSDVTLAREGAARSQRVTSLQAIDDALMALQPPRTAGVVSGQTESAAIDLLPAAPTPSMPARLSAPPAVLYRLEPGHWQLRGAESVWVEAQTVPQPVSVRPLVPPRQVWDGGRWVLAPEHFAATENPP